MLLLLPLLLSIDRSGAEIDSRTAFPAASEKLLLTIDGERKFALLSFLAPWLLPFPPCRSGSEIRTAFPAASSEIIKSTTLVIAIAISSCYNCNQPEETLAMGCAISTQSLV
ncbi:unnamed protein product [Sphagnum jensenii]|uniref:Secreted protein n=1 Tax=Sphagnum jensenii TaxID=128206 RepID=A0ABP1A5D2_9BRYO